MVTTGENWRRIKRSARKQRHRFGEAELSQSAFAGAQLLFRPSPRNRARAGDPALADEHDFGDGFGGVGVQVNAGAVFERTGRGEQIDLDIQALAGAKEAGGHEHHAARKFFGRDRGEIQRRALPGDGVLGGLIVVLDAAHAHPPRAGQNFDLFLFANGA